MKEAIIFMAKIWLLLTVLANSIISFVIFMLFIIDKNINTEKITLVYTLGNASAIFISILGTFLIWLVDKLDN